MRSQERSPIRSWVELKEQARSGFRLKMGALGALGRMGGGHNLLFFFSLHWFLLPTGIKRRRHYVICWKFCHFGQQNKTLCSLLCTAKVTYLQTPGLRHDQQNEKEFFYIKIWHIFTATNTKSYNSKRYFLYIAERCQGSKSNFKAQISFYLMMLRTIKLSTVYNGQQKKMKAIFWPLPICGFFAESDTRFRQDRPSSSK